MKRSLCILLVVLLLAGCQPNTPSDVIEETKNVLSLCSAGGTNPLNPAAKSDKALFDLLYDPLFVTDATFAPQGALAESYTVDGTTVTVRLYPDLLFSDGTAVDARDVVDTVMTVKYHPEYVYYPSVKNIYDLHVVDPQTVEFTLLSPDPFFLEKLNFPILPSEAKTGLYPAGTGRYRLTDALQNEHTFEVNEYYRGTPPLIGTLRVHLLPDGETVCYAYRAGTVDALYTQARRISDYSGVGSTATPFESMKFTFIGYRTDHPLLQHQNVRQAISQAVDRQKLAETILMGYGTVTDLPFHPAHYRFADLLEAPTTADLETVTDLLLKTPSDEEGNGIPLTFTLLVNGDDVAAINMAASLSVMLAPAGLTVTVEEQPFETYTQRIAEGSFDAYLGQVDFSTLDMAAELLVTDGALNFGGFTNEKVDQAFADLRTAASDAAFHTAATDLTVLLQREQPLLSLFFEQDLLMTKNVLTGDLPPTPDRPFNGAEFWER